MLLFMDWVLIQELKLLKRMTAYYESKANLSWEKLLYVLQVVKTLEYVHLQERGFWWEWTSSGSSDSESPQTGITGAMIL